MLVGGRIKGIPITFLVVLVLTVLLVIFFGAWAVSADAAGRDKEFAFGIAVGGSTLAGPDSRAAPDGRPVTSDEESESKTDSWWGKAVLKACPFH